LYIEEMRSSDLTQLLEGIYRNYYKE